MKTGGSTRSIIIFPLLISMTGCTSNTDSPSPSSVVNLDTQNVTLPEPKVSIDNMARACP